MKLLMIKHLPILAAEYNHSVFVFYRNCIGLGILKSLLDRQSLPDDQRG